LCRLGVLRRPEADFDLTELESVMPGITRRIDFVIAPPVSASSQEIRARAAVGASLVGLVPARVAALIEAERIYASDDDV
ncbi:MAG TPA: hypothetical protein PK954_26120, partial [Anaerolineales bacterium]|nr:hypothetical protein [Anaerolineales bacterium]